MGTHAFGSSAFLLTIEDFYVLLMPSHLLGIRNDATRLMRKRSNDTHRARRGYSAVQSLSTEERNELEQVANDLSSACSIQDVRRILQALVDKAQANHDSEEAEFDDHETLQIAFTSICRVVLPIQPECVTIIRPEHVDMGDDPPTDTPLLWFKYEDCFSVEMTAGGRQLARTLGRSAIGPLSWTSMG
jgi:hypothetical protein